MGALRAGTRPGEATSRERPAARRQASTRGSRDRRTAPFPPAGDGGRLPAMAAGQPVRRGAPGRTASHVARWISYQPLRFILFGMPAAIRSTSSPCSRSSEPWAADLDGWSSSSVNAVPALSVGSASGVAGWRRVNRGPTDVESRRPARVVIRVTLDPGIQLSKELNHLRIPGPAEIELQCLELVTECQHCEVASRSPIDPSLKSSASFLRAAC